MRAWNWQLSGFPPGWTQRFEVPWSACYFCESENWDISQAKPDDTINYNMSPQKIVDLAIEYNTKTIAYTYTEPTVFFEYMLETSKNAHTRGILNVYHSNGYINQEPLAELIPYLDGANVDLKAHSDEFYKEITSGTLYPVLETLKALKQNGVWLEIPNLVIPTIIDNITSGTTSIMSEFKNISPSIESFIARLGNQPPVIVPRIMAIIIPIKDDQVAYAEKVKDNLQNKGLRVIIDNRNESLNKRIREGTISKVPYVLIVGDKEAQASQVAVRKRTVGDQGSSDVEKFLSEVLREIKEKK